MKKVGRWIPGLLIGLMVSGYGVAAPPNTAMLDGIPSEYDDVDLVGTNTQPPGFGPSDVITNLYVTWDSDYVYVALEGRENGNKLAVMLDVDPEAGTGATSTTNWVNNPDSAIGYNDVGWSAAGDTPFGLDYMIASEGFYNSILRVLYDGETVPVLDADVAVLFDVGNGASPQGSPVDMVILATDSQVCTKRGIEARIPWSELYGGSRFGTVEPGDVVPVGATIRMFANLHNNDNTSSYSAPDAIPEQVSPSASYADGHLVTDTYIDVVVDADLDGMPDLGIGDVNAPFLSSVSGAAGSTSTYVTFNETVTDPTAVTAANYLVGGAVPTAAVRLEDRSIRLDLAAALPTDGTEVLVTASGVQDASGNARTTTACLTVGEGGIPVSVTVKFVLETASGFGPEASAFHLNSDIFPLEEGFPPATSTPLAVSTGSAYEVAVTFPAGTPRQIGYRYSGLRTDTGTNTYEAIRLADYEFMRRQLELPTDGTAITVHDRLGPAGPPYRTGTSGSDDLYLDPTRGDAGVTQAVDLVFQLDLSQRNLAEVQRVVVQGSDPLRGFNADSLGNADWAGGGAVGWLNGGIQLYDDGTLGDLEAGDGIFTRLWRATTTGNDSELESAPGSLVGGSFSTLPFGGFGWATQRSPRSISYKYYVVYSDTEGLESPGTNIDLYIPENATNIVLSPFVWENNSLPIATSTNPAVILDIVRMAEETHVVYSNIIQAADNAIETSVDPTGTWDGYGLRGAGVNGIFTAVVARATAGTESYRVVTPGADRAIAYWDPHPVPLTGGTVRVYYDQNKRDLAGEPDVKLAGSFNNWSGTPMVFDGAGKWHADVVLEPGLTSNPEFKFNNTPVNPTIWEGNNGNNYAMLLDRGGASWTPNRPSPGGTITITFDATQASGTALVDQAQVYIWYGFDAWEDTTWSGGSAPGLPMNSIGTNLWEITLEVPAEFSRTVSWVFNSGPDFPDGSTQWQNNHGKDWHAFLELQ